jgi:hypothetical protein
MIGELSDDGRNYDQLIRKGTIRKQIYEAQELVRIGIWDEAIKKLDGIGLTKDEKSQFTEVSRDKSMYKKAKSIEGKLTSASLKNIDTLEKDIEGLNIDDDARKRLKGLHKDRKINLLTAEIDRLKNVSPGYFNTRPEKR